MKHLVYRRHAFRLFTWPAMLLMCLSGMPGSTAARQSPTPQAGTAFEAQRNKVNDLLNQRSTRFGQYNESLQQRTGIFGLKTKRDMQASIDILQQIVITDNDIFRETKQLLDFKDFEKSQATEQATEFDGRINGYVKTISKLQQEQERLGHEIHALEASERRYKGLLLLAVLGFVTILWLLMRRKKLTKR